MARSGHRMWTDGQFVYVVGGWNRDHHNGLEDEQDRQMVKDVWCLNIWTDTWQEFQTHGSFPNGFTKFSMCYDAERERFLIIRVWDSTHELYALNLRGPKRGHWEILSTTGDIPVKSRGQVLLSVDLKDTFYHIGGLSITEFEDDNSVHKLQLARAGRKQRCETKIADSISLVNVIWSLEVRDPQCAKRDCFEALHRKGKIYLFGGETNYRNAEFDKLDVFNIETRQWEVVQTHPDFAAGFPRPRQHHAVVEFEDKAYVLGGVIFRPNHVIYDDIWELQFGSLQWRKLPQTLPEPVHDHSATVTKDGCLYLFGGICGSAEYIWTNKAFRMWLKPPPLSWLAVKALLRSCPEISAHNVQDLMRMGVPLRVAELMQHDE